MTLLDNAELRAQFPATENLVYLDAAHQTPLCRRVRARLDSFYGEAISHAGPKATWLRRVHTVRERLADLLGTTPDAVAFTKNTSEGLNTAARGLPLNEGDNVLVLGEEHPNNVYAWLALQSSGVEVRFVPADKEWADADTFAPYTDARTRVISLSHVMFHNGQRNDVASVAELTARHGIELVVDAMQSVGVLPLQADRLGAAALAAGSHKGLLTPHGLGFLHTTRTPEQLAPTYVALASVANARPDLYAVPGDVELRQDALRFETGNVNLAAVHAMGAALELITEIGTHAIEDHVLDLGDQLIASADDLGIGVVGPRERTHRSHIYALDLTAPEWPAYLDSRGVRVSPTRGGIRVSFGFYNDTDDLDRFFTIVRSGLREIDHHAA